MIKEINSKLHKEIKVFGIKLVTKNFNAKNSASSRQYEYLLPLSMLRTESNQNQSNEEILERLNSILRIFQGTHNFHNYTPKGQFNMKTNERHIMGCKAELIGTQPNWVKVLLHGQSFIYNQIRKMIGMVISVFQNELDESFILNSFSQNVCPVWLAPSEGLLLDKVLFNGYNKKSDAPEILELT